MNSQSPNTTATNPALLHIASDPAVCGGKPCIAGTRIRVWDVHVWHELRGWSPAEIISQFPQLTLAAVYAALAFYHDHRSDIERQILEDNRLAEEIEAHAGTSAFKRLQQELLSAPIPSR